MLVHDVMKCLPNEVGEILHVVEFIVYNTPGPHGFSPRDIDRRWSMSSALERELQPFQIQEFEPVSEYIRNIFQCYREIRVKVLSHLKDKSLQRAELANRFRRNKQINVGDKVIIRDKRAKALGGRTPYKQPLS